MNLSELQRALRQLRLGGIAAVLETRLHQAQTEPMVPIDLISCLVSDELTRRSDRLLDRRRKQAGFRDANKTLDNFDFTFNPKMNRSLIFDLATCGFIAKRHDALFLGPGRSCDILHLLATQLKSIGIHSSVSGRRAVIPRLQPPVSSPISANIGMAGPLETVRLLGLRFARATSCTTSADSIASIGISQGAHGTTWVAGILFDSISRRMTLWLMPSRSDACSKVTVLRDTRGALQAGNS